jgi:hypothetical protein
LCKRRKNNIDVPSAAIVFASGRKYFKCLKWLLKIFETPFIVPFEGCMTALQTACTYGYTKIAQYLLDTQRPTTNVYRRHVVSREDDLGKSLIWACKYNQKEIVKILLANGALVDYQNVTTVSNDFSITPDDGAYNMIEPGERRSAIELATTFLHLPRDEDAESIFDMLCNAGAAKLLICTPNGDKIYCSNTPPSQIIIGSTPCGGTQRSVHDPSGTATSAVHTSLGTKFIPMNN